MMRKRGAINRFVVMAMLQAARAQILGLKRESAYSWGLNRAIFYAAAKRGFRGGTPPSEGRPQGEGGTLPPQPTRELYRLGDDEAYRDPKAETLLFTIGDKDQTPADFQRQISARFGSKENFQNAWDEAMKIVKSYDRPTLESRQRFYSDVYKPRRDELSEAWGRNYSPASRSTVS
jgi:hypothetical protein